MTVLEVGCGHGIALAEVAARVGPHGRLVGIDRSAKMIEATRRSCAREIAEARVTLLQGELAQVPLEVATFDLVFAINVRLFADADEELERVKASLVPGGELHLFFETPGWAHAERYIHEARDNLTAHGFHAVARAHPPIGVHVSGRLGAKGRGRAAALNADR